jgi:integrase
VAAARTRPNDPYIIGGQRSDQYNIRSGAFGKRFGYLRGVQGHGQELVFHSLRRTVATLLENAGAPEGIAADILGHEKKTLSYGLYSSGSSMQRKIEAIEKLISIPSRTTRNRKRSSGEQTQVRDGGRAPRSSSPEF